MARGVSLGELVDKLRVAARFDPNPALSQNMVPLFEQTLRDTQERLYDEFDWPFLRVRRDKAIEVGQRYYDVPDDMNLERIVQIDVLVNDKWLPVDRGISLDHYNAVDSDNDERRDPIMRWDVSDTGEGEQIEVWPIPATPTTMRFTGFRQLKPLRQRADIADLDDQLIVLYAAGEIMGGATNPDAQVKFAQAKRRKELLQGRVTKSRRNSFVLGGEDLQHNPRGVPMVSRLADWQID